MSLSPLPNFMRVGLVSSLLASQLQAQTTSSSPQVEAQTDPAGAVTEVSDASRPALAGVGPNERVWRTDDPRSNRRVIEMATGMNYWDGQQWTPSDPRFEITDDAFVADKLQQKVRLSADLNTIGAVTVVTRDGITLRSTPVGIGLYDAASGQSAIIAATTNCSGVLVGDNRVVYENAFNGICADVVYTIECGSFAQDVVFTGRLDPADYGFPTNTTRIQIFTEFYNPPEPDSVLQPLRVEQDANVRSRMASPDLVDEVLGFGEFVIATGRAATLANISKSDAPGAPVAKQFSTIAGRTFLIESMENGLVQADLKGLPDCGVETASVNKTRKGKLAELAIPSASKAAHQASAAPKSSVIRRMAQAGADKRAGFVVDYLATIGGTLSGTRVFQGDTTYFLTNAVTCSGAVTIEGGAVFKFPTNSTSYLKLTGTVTCKTSSYRPAIFTAGDDDTVGDPITTNIWSGYTGTIRTNGYGNPALWVYYLSSPALSHLRFRYSQIGVQVEGSSVSSTFSHAQLVNCIKGIVITGCGSGSSGPVVGITGNNLLMSGVQYPLTFIIAPNPAKFYNSTIDSTPRVISASASSSTSFTNSVFANVTALYSGTVTLSGGYNGFYLSPTFGASQFSATNYPFQSVGAGYYYLASGSGFRDVGITNIGSALLSELKKRTTYPPQVPTNTVTSATTLSPQAQRDTDTPDLGYHYEAIDYAVNTLAIAGTSLTLTNGVALASYGNNGIWLEDGSQLYSEGTPLNHNHLTRFFNVQEQPTNWGGATLSAMMSITPYNYGSPPGAQIRFTDFDGVANSGYHIYTLNTNWTFSSLLLWDSSFNSGSFYLDGPTNSVLGVTNNLFERVAGSFKNAPQITLYNNLYRFGSLTTTNTGSGTNNWVLKDNAFDSTTITNSTTGLTAAYNAYINMGTNRFIPTNVNDQVLTSFTYTNGTLGGYYQVSTNLYDMGSRNATNAGLYHYTVKTSQAKETNSVVDIGFHYVAVDANGNPVDTDGDGIPDYLEDRNGDGNGANDATSWQNYNSPNGLTGNPGLQVFTPLR